MKLRYLFACFCAFSNADIIIRGNDSVVTDKIKILIEHIFDIDEIKKALYETGLFDKVDVVIENENYISNVAEKKILSKMVFFVNGSKKSKGDIGPSYDMLEQVSKLKIGNVVDKQKIETAKSNIERIHLEQGYSNIFVHEKIIPATQLSNGIQLEFDIKRGPKLYIHNVNFIGLKNLDPEALRKTLTPRIKNYILFYSISPEPFLLQQDADKILAQAYEEGFWKAKIKDSYIETKNDQQFIYIVMNEGNQYEIGKSPIKAHESIDYVKIEDTISGVANSYKINEFESKIFKIYRKLGKSISIRVEKIFDDENKKVDVVFHVEPQEKKHVASKIIIKGNERTRSNVILQNARFDAGDYFDSQTIGLIESRIRRLGLFSEVRVIPVLDIDSPEKSAYTLTILVKELPVGEIGLMGSAAYQTNWDFSISLFYGNPNFLGKGHHFLFNVTKGTDSDSFQIGYTVPTIYGKDISFSNNFSMTKYANSGSSIKERFNKDVDKTALDSNDVDTSFGYKVKSVSFFSGLGFDLNEFGYLKPQIGFEHQTIDSDTFSKESNRARFFKEDMMPKERTILNLGLTHSIGQTFHSKQNISFRTYGNLNFGSKTSNFQIMPKFTTTYPITRSQNVYIQASLSYGYIYHFENNHYWMDNFQSGVSTGDLKGFSEIGPREIHRYTPIGGAQKANAYIELITPFILPEEWKFSAFIGMYWGSLWGSKYPEAKILPQYAKFRKIDASTSDIISDEFCARSSASMGLRWNLGPFKLEWAFSSIISKHEADKTKTFSFKISM
jgi:outer membrane protein insertion porin family